MFFCFFGLRNPGFKVYLDHSSCTWVMNILSSTDICPLGAVAWGRVRCFVPERRELWEADGLDVDLRLPVEPSSGVLQLDGVNLTESERVGQHRPVHRGVRLTETRTHVRILHNHTDQRLDAQHTFQVQIHTEHWWEKYSDPLLE